MYLVRKNLLIKLSYNSFFLNFINDGKILLVKYKIL